MGLSPYQDQDQKRQPGFARILFLLKFTQTKVY